MTLVVDMRLKKELWISVVNRIISSGGNMKLTASHHFCLDVLSLCEESQKLVGSHLQILRIDSFTQT